MDRTFKKINLKKILLVIFCFALNSCLNNHSIQVTDSYFIDNLGDSSTKWLFFRDPNTRDSGEGIVSGVEAVGYNKNFIIIKASLNNYYILNYSKNKKKYFEVKYLQGPYSEEQFNLKRKDLNIDEINFTIYP